VASDTGDILPS